jgi:hypothetical protein
VNESVSSKEISVADTFEYKITFDSKLPETLSYPSGDFVEEGEELPLFKVLKAEKHSDSLILTLRFYSPGEFTLPIEWLVGKTPVRSELKIKINSQLTGEETDIEANEAPINFSGYFLHRLLFAICLFAIVTYFLYALFLMWKKQKRIVDTNWEKIPEIESRLKKLYQIEEFLNQEHIPYKDFCFLFSSYCKEEYSYRLKTDLLSYTDSEFLAYLYDHSGLEESILREIRSIFRKVKYSDIAENLSRDEASSLWLNWKDKLKL